MMFFRSRATLISLLRLDEVSNERVQHMSSSRQDVMCLDIFPLPQAGEIVDTLSTKQINLAHLFRAKQRILFLAKDCTLENS